MDTDKVHVKSIKELHETLDTVVKGLETWKIHLDGHEEVSEISQCLGQLRAGRTWLGRYLERTEKT